MVPGTAFSFDHRGKIKRELTHVRRIIGISTYGSPRTYVAAINDNGRRILTRALRLTCGIGTRTTWIPFYAIDTATDEQRGEFLTSVEARLGRLT
jgi:putative NADPH-quinone reductase